LIKKSESSAEAAAREIERKVNQLLEESSIAFYKGLSLCDSEITVLGEPRAGLEKAKEAAKRERQLAKQREANSIVDGMNFDLTYAVYFNLANMYHKNQMYQEALNTYKIIVKNKQYPQGGRMRVNMGNIYFEQQNYNEAIKMYRMAMDQIPNTAKEIR
jgi:intraflagellar transport protein 88